MSRQTVRQAGHRPPVSNVFQAWPHAHDQRSEADGSQEHLGQAICMGGAVRWAAYRPAPGSGSRHAREDGGNTDAEPWAAPPRPRTFVVLTPRPRPMKTDIHPDYTFVTVTLADGSEFTTRSTMDRDELRSEVDSSNHPFYTGKKTMVDTAGRVEKFMRRYGRDQAKTVGNDDEGADAAEGTVTTDAGPATTPAEETPAAA